MMETREGGCHCGEVRFRAKVDLDRLSQCNCTVCTKKGILHLVTDPADFELLKGKDAITAYTFQTGVAQHTFCSHCGMQAFYVPRSQPDRILDGRRTAPTHLRVKPSAPLRGQPPSPHTHWRTRS